MASQLRYVGFDQAKNIRKYKFDGVAANETTAHFVVNADLALFFRYHVALQEGPALCLKRLSADLEMLRQLPHELTGGDLADHVSAQAAAAAKRITKRKRRRTGRDEYRTYPATSGI
jgi:hypothetical protein